MKTLICGLALSAALLPAAAAAADSNLAALHPMNNAEAVAELASKGYRDLREISGADDSVRATIRDRSGRMRDVEIDRVSGEVRLAETPAIYRNSIDPLLFTRLRGTLAEKLPEGARPLHEIVPMVMATGQWSDVEEIRVGDNLYRLTMRAADGRRVELQVDPASGAVAKSGG